eukprot:4927558-Pyramimonas_sp.AAC.1
MQGELRLRPQLAERCHPSCRKPWHHDWPDIANLCAASSQVPPCTVGVRARGRGHGRTCAA